MSINKGSIYKQIDAFNNKPSNPKVKGSKPFVEAYLYVDTNSAQDCSSFFKYAKEKINYSFKNPNILDLAFGSGNLTSHIILDNIEKFNKIYFNDINDEVNIDLIETIGEKAELSTNSFLKSEEWTIKQKTDIIIFNPQIGGGYDNGESGLKKESVIISDKTFEEYLKSKGNKTEDITIKETDYKIDVHSDTLTKTALKNLLKDINIFNYKDVFYQSKNSKKEGQETNTVKFRATFDKVFNKNGIVVFYGDDDAFKSLFADFNTVYKYNREGNNLYIALKQHGKEITIEEYCKYGDTFDICKEKDKANKVEGDIPEIQTEIGTAIKELAQTTQTDNSIAQEDKIDETEKKKVEDEKAEPFKIDVSPVGNIDFPHKNILLKGVPGTGKSRMIDVKLLKEIGLNTITHPNILRINVHSASSNSDLMQGIGVSAQNGEIEYHEKQGLILNHLKEAIKKPNQAFAIVLEEIQENNLNELIGDLIYLIEDEKRADVSDFVKNDKEFESFDAFVNELIKYNENTHFVQIPYLVSSNTKYRKLIIPNNLYFFCTSNYRDDKKIIEDNLLRRFDLIELYPKVSVIKNENVSLFLKALNDSILSVLDGKEIHSDRFLIGHAYWINVKDEKTFYQALLKTLTEFKDIREIEFSDVKKFFEKIDTDIEKTPFKTDLSILKNGKNYKEIIFSLQEKAFGDLLQDNEK